MTDAALTASQMLRAADYDRYLAAMLAPAEKRKALFALYAFNYEVAKTGESVREPFAGAIRLQWWRDAIARLCAGETPQAGILPLLAEAIAAHALPRALFDALIDARENDLAEAPFDDCAAFTAYADATSGAVMALAARILGAGESLDTKARDAGIAYAFAGLLRALPFHAARRRLMLPADVVREAGLTAEEIFAGICDARMTALIHAIARLALTHLSHARTRLPRRFLPAFLPAGLAPLTLKAMTKKGFDPFRDSTEIPAYRRQLRMTGALLRGRL